MFPGLPTRGNIVAETKFASREAKCFLANSETFDVSLCFSLMFPSVCPHLETWRNIGRKQCLRNNVSSFAHLIIRRKFFNDPLAIQESKIFFYPRFDECLSVSTTFLLYRIHYTTLILLRGYSKNTWVGGV